MTDNKKDKNKLTFGEFVRKYRDAIIGISIIVLFITAGLVHQHGMKVGWFETPMLPEQVPQETAAVEYSAADFDGKTMTQDFGRSDTFYKPEEGTKVIIDFGTGTFDITDMVAEWSFGEPIINLTDLAPIMNCHISLENPKGYSSTDRYEIYGENEYVDISNRHPVFLMNSDDTDYVMYTVSSKIAIDNMGYQYSASYAVTEDGEGNYYVSAEHIPYIDTENNWLIMMSTASYDYKEDSIIITIRPRENDMEEN